MAKEALDAKGVPYVYIDITSGMAPLRKFLKFRDTHPIFEPVKAGGSVGLPLFVVDKTELSFEMPDDLDAFLPE